jgi:hypothetical protein
VVSSTRTIKDGRTVRQLLIDSYAANHPTTDDGAKKQPLLIADDDDQPEKSTTTTKNSNTGQWGEEASLKDVRKGAKYPTHFLQQLRVLTVRTFKQRRPAILSAPQIIVVVIFAIASSLFWLRMDKDGTPPTDPSVQHRWPVPLTRGGNQRRAWPIATHSCFTVPCIGRWIQCSLPCWHVRVLEITLSATPRRQP